YLVAAAVLLLGVRVLVSGYGLPAKFLPWTTFLAALGLLPMLVLSWFFDVVPDPGARASRIAPAPHRPEPPAGAAPASQAAEEVSAVSVRGDLTALLEALARAPAAATGEAWAHPLLPGDRIDRFSIVRELGRGGFGAVYEAHDQILERRVALKTLRPGRSRDEGATEELRREARAAARLSHPGIVTLYEACTCHLGPFLVMELLRGETLAERLLRGPLDPREAVEIALQAARALAHIHTQGLVHRDLKPGNLFLGDDARVRLLDLGLAHLLGRGSVPGGTPGYVAPEQWRGEAVDGRADVFSLGAVLFEMLTGRRPFEDRDERSATPPPAPVLDGVAPRRLRALVSSCLHREPAARPAAAPAAAALAEIQRQLDRPRALRRTAALAALGGLLGAGITGLVAWRFLPR
ncbi:MAG TPA: serine/threonine-protein kinase, partial [Anaeromyxobacteraceae bacterium]